MDFLTRGDMVVFSSITIPLFYWLHKLPKYSHLVSLEVSIYKGLRQVAGENLTIRNTSF